MHTLNPIATLQEDFVRRGGHVCAVDLLVWCDAHEPPPPAPGKDDFHMETVCTLVNIIGNAARSSVKVPGRCTSACSCSFLPSSPFPVAVPRSSASMLLRFNLVLMHSLVSRH